MPTIAWPKLLQPPIGCDTSGAFSCSAGLSPPALFFFFNDTATTEIYTLSLHDALPISDNDETDPAPAPACADGLDNDGDGFIDYPADPGCSRAADGIEIDE